MIKTIFLLSAAALARAVPNPDFFSDVHDLFDGNDSDLGSFLDDLGIGDVAMEDLPQEAQDYLHQEFSDDELNSGSGYLLRTFADRCYNGDCQDEEKKWCLEEVAKSYKDMEEKEEGDQADTSAMVASILDGMDDNACINFDKSAAVEDILIDIFD